MLGYTAPQGNPVTGQLGIHVVDDDHPVRYGDQRPSMRRRWKATFSASQAPAWSVGS